ncbi:MAG: hypothetical protein QJR03_07095 [Sphaerobacter sp.]|nr:hypothetical protein [Sphaerobacter sp.]
MNIRDVLLWGFTGTTVLTTIMRGAAAIGQTRIDLPLILGLTLTPNRDRAKVYGFLFHLANGWIFALLYAATFQYFRRATWWLGMLVGAVHALFVLIVGLPALPGLHPRMATDARGPEPTLELEPPGFLAINYGRQTAVVTILAHLTFGAILGTFYRPKPARRAVPR